MNTTPDTRPLAERIEGKIDKEIAAGLAVVGTGGAVSIAPKDMGELMEFAKMMSLGGVALRKEFRNNPGTCLALAIQALRWGMDPFAVAAKAYVVNDQVAYEAQLCHAVVNMRAPLQTRLRHEYSGEGQTRKCAVSGLLIGETKDLEYESPTIANIPVKNSPLWKNDPDQQLGYYAVRAWARRHVPEVLLGVYTGEEMEAGTPSGPEHARDITPRPTRVSVAQETDPQGHVETFLQVDGDGEIIHEYTSAAAYTEALTAAMREEGADFHTIFEANGGTPHTEYAPVDGIGALKERHEEGCYDPLVEAYEALCKAEGDGTDETGTEGAEDEETATEGSGEGDGRVPSIVLEESEAGVKDWKKLATDLGDAIKAAPTVEAVDAIMKLHGLSVDEMYEAGAKASANQVKRAAEARITMLGPRRTAEAVE